MWKISNKTTVILHDLIMTVLAWQLVWWARFNFQFSPMEWETSVAMLPFVVLVQGIIYWRFQLYRGVWRFASLPDLWNIIRAALFGGLCVTLVLFIFYRLEGVPRSILILYPVFLVFLLGGPRLGYRLWKDHTFNFKAVTQSETALIIGAGRAGEMIARDMLRSGNYLPVGFVDDNVNLKSSAIHGIRILGPIKNLEEIVDKYNPAMIIVAIPSASDEQMQRIVAHCEKTSKPIRTLPKLADMMSKEATLSELKTLSIEDLLGREKVELDWKEIQSSLLNKTVMVTGGGGSIGSELCRQIVKLGPTKLIIFEQSEFNLYKIQQQLLKINPSLEILGILGDVCDHPKIEHIVEHYRPDVIFHAAAYKHVPLLQNQVREAIRNNVFGTIYVADAADKYGCEKFVLISTDKAVNPANILGLSKRVAEMYCESKISETRFITVRFGNVLGSDGSVVPLFQEQIKNGGPVTVTHPEAKRFFMTISEACQLILQAGAMGMGGEIFILDMGNPVKIAYLAEQLIKLSGAIPHHEIKIEFIGLRPGEKLSEELFYENEIKQPTSHKKILLAKHPEINQEFLAQTLDELQQAIIEFNDKKLEEMLWGVVQQVNKDDSKVVSLEVRREG